MLPIQLELLVLKYCNDESRANAAFVSKTWMIEIYKNMDLHNIICHAHKYGIVKLLKYFQNRVLHYLKRCSGRDHQYYLKIVCEHGHISILDWWLRQQAKFTNTDVYINAACKYGHIKILDWFIDNLVFQQSIDAIDLASEYGHEHVLQWWYDNYKLHRVNFIYSESSLIGAYNNKRIGCLHWWINHINVFSPITYSKSDCFKSRKTLRKYCNSSCSDSSNSSSECH